MLGMFDNATVAITVSGIDLMALKKLAIVSHALADKIGGSAGREQQQLVAVLDNLIRKIELTATAK